MRNLIKVKNPGLTKLNNREYLNLMTRTGGWIDTIGFAALGIEEEAMTRYNQLLEMLGNLVAHSYAQAETPEMAELEKQRDALGLYIIDNVRNAQDLYIVEGEMDALSLAEIGYMNVVSVPDGGADKTMHWLVDYYEEYFADKKTVYICSDNDNVGTGLATELAKRATGQTIYILDEPTTGLHAADVHKLIDVLQELVNAGNTVLVIEHNLDVIKVADHIIDLGPEGGDGGGYVVATGTPEEVAQVEGSYTGQYLKRYLEM